MNKSLYNIKAGDEVIVHSYYGKTIKQVSRITTNYIVIGLTKYRKSDGGMCGTGTNYLCYITLATDEELQIMRQKQAHEMLIKQVSSIPFHSLTSAQLQAILNIVRDS